MDIFSYKVWGLKWWLTVIALSIVAFILPCGIVLIIIWLNNKCDKEIKDIDTIK